MNGFALFHQSYVFLQESQDLKADRDKLKREVEELRAHKELNDATVKEKVTEAKHSKHQIASLKEKVELLERALSTMVRNTCTSIDTKPELRVDEMRLESDSKLVIHVTTVHNHED